MHEFSIVSHLLDLVARDVKKHEATGVSRVTVKIGVMSGVVPQLFREAFDTIKRGTPAENADLEIIEQNILISCECGYCGEIENNHFVCPQCRNRNIDIREGEELILQQLELDMPEENPG